MTLTSEQKTRRAENAAVRLAHRQFVEGTLAEQVTLADGTVARVGDVVEWYRGMSQSGPEDGRLTVTAITANGFVVGTYPAEFRSAFGGGSVMGEMDALVEADRLRTPEVAP